MLSKQFDGQIQRFLSVLGNSQSSTLFSVNSLPYTYCVINFLGKLDQFICLHTSSSRAEHYVAVKMDYVKATWLLMKKASHGFPRTHQ